MTLVDSFYFLCVFADPTSCLSCFLGKGVRQCRHLSKDGASEPERQDIPAHSSVLQADMTPCPALEASQAPAPSATRVDPRPSLLSRRALLHPGVTTALPLNTSARTRCLHFTARFHTPEGYRSFNSASGSSVFRSTNYSAHSNRAPTGYKVTAAW